MAHRTGGVLSRDGLSTRAYGQSDQAQIAIELGQGYNLDTEIDGLRSQVGRLKEMSRAIGEESRLQKEQAESLEDLMEKAKVELKRGMRRLSRAFQQSKSNHLLYLVLFCVAVFAFLYVWAKFYRLMKWIR